jgi:hypothetical protein
VVIPFKSPDLRCEFARLDFGCNAPTLAPAGDAKEKFSNGNRVDAADYAKKMNQRPRDADNNDRTQNIGGGQLSEAALGE